MIKEKIGALKRKLGGDELAALLHIESLVNSMIDEAVKDLKKYKEDEIRMTEKYKQQLHDKVVIIRYLEGRESEY